MEVVYHRGSCVSDVYELRISKRCLADDLERAPNTAFEEALSHDIVRGFVNQRRQEHLGTKIVGPAAGERTLYRLAYGEDHRGATWYDAAENVIWLCAYGLHRSGEADDAFPYFSQLMAAGTIMPTVQDYTSLFRDRGRRFAETVATDAAALLAQARAEPGREHKGILGGAQHAGVVVNVVDTLEETYVAFPVPAVEGYARILVMLRAFFVDAAFSDWELVDALPTQQLDDANGEICYRILHG